MKMNPASGSTSKIMEGRDISNIEGKNLGILRKSLSSFPSKKTNKSKSKVCFRNYISDVEVNIILVNIIFFCFFSKHHYLD